MTIGMISAWLVAVCLLTLCIMGVCMVDRRIRSGTQQPKPQPGKAAIVSVTVKPVPADTNPLPEPRMITNIKYGALNR
jgi:hypothetical protein